MSESKNIGQKKENRDTLAIANRLNEFHSLHIEISREQGQITALQDETDKTIRSNLDRIKSLRYSVREKQKKLKELAEVAGLEINQLFS